MKGYRTLLFNIASCVVAVAGAIAGQPFIIAHPKITAAVAGAIAVGNFALRFLTDTPVGSK
jgi:hypothetical protein